MRAAFLESPGRMVVREVPAPDPRTPGLLCAVTASGICGSDLREYVRGPRAGRPQPGHEVVLRVVSVVEGDGLSGNLEALKAFAPGDRLCVCSVSCGKCPECLRGDEHMCAERSHVGFEAPSGFSEFAFVPLRSVLYGSLFRVTPDIEDATASLLEPLACVICGHEKVRVLPGDTVVVLGAGPVGCMHGMVARLRGASCVVLVDVKETRLQMAPAGSYHVRLNSAETDVEKAILELTGGAGADVVVVACADPGAHTLSVRLARKNGQVLFFSGLSPEDRLVKVDADLVHRREVEIVGSRNSGRRHFKRALGLLARNARAFGELVTHVVTLEEVDRGFRMALEGRAMKVVVMPEHR